MKQIPVRMSARRWLIAGLMLIAAVAAWALLSHGVEPTPSLPEGRPQELGARLPAPRAVTTPGAPDAAAGEEEEDDGDGLFIDVVSAVDGAPLQGAWVYVGWQEEPVPYRGHAGSGYMGFNDHTDAKGHVKVRVTREPGDQARTLYLKVTNPYFRPHKQRFESGPVALEPLAPWRGRVLTSAGRPAGGAMVSSVSHADVHTRTADDGRFELALPQPDRLFAELNGEVATSERAVEGQELTLKLARPEQSSGVVTGRDGAPLAGVTLTITARATTWQQHTGRDGRFSVPMLERVTPWLRFEKPGYVTKACPFDEEDEKIVLSRAGRLEGTLLDQGRQPVSGFEVTLYGARSAVYMPVREIGKATTGPDGRFVFESLDEPVMKLVARAAEPAGEGDDDEDPKDRGELLVTLPEGATARVVMVLPPKRTRVEVEYESIAGVEVHGCETTASPVPPAGWNSQTTYSKLQLSRGRFLFEVVCDDERTAREERDVDPARDTVLRFVVRGDGGEEYDDEKPPEKVRVRVVRPDGTPVSGATVTAHDTIGQTGTDGRFSFEVRAAASLWPLQVRATGDGAAGAARVMNAAAGETTIVVKPRMALRGRVEGVVPPGAWRVAVRSVEETSDQKHEGGAFELEDRAAVRTFVCIEGDGLKSLGCAVWEGSSDEVVIRVGAPGEVRFTAVDAKGAPIEWLVLYLDRQGLFDESAPDGEMTLEVAAGEHVLILNVDGSRARHEVRFTVKPGELTDLGTLRLE